MLPISTLNEHSVSARSPPKDLDTRSTLRSVVTTSPPDDPGALDAPRREK